MKKIILFTATCLMSVFLHAQDLDRVLPEPVPKQVDTVEAPESPERITQEQLDELGIRLWAAPDEDILLPELKGVRLVGSPEEVDSAKVNAANPLVSEVGDPELRQSLLILLSAYTEKPASEESIDRMIIALRLLLAQAGYPFSVVYLPPQDVTDGFLHLVVVESRIGDIQVEGNKYFS